MWDAHYVAISVVSELLKPPRYVDICLVLCDVVDEQGSDRTTVVARTGWRAVPWHQLPVAAGMHLQYDCEKTHADVMARYRSCPAARFTRRKPCAISPLSGCPLRSWRQHRRRQRTCVPDLSLDRLAVDGDGAGRKLDADGRLALEVELVAREPREDWARAGQGIKGRKDGQAIQ